MKEDSKKNPPGEGGASQVAVDAAMQYESAADFDELLAAFRREHEPSGATSEYLRFIVAMAAWHKRRLALTETGLCDAPVEEVCRRQENFNHYNPPLKGTARDAFDGNANANIIRAGKTLDGLFHKALAKIKEQRTPGKKGG